jgi:hypothetical protein
VTLKRLSDVGFHAVELSQVPMTPDSVDEITSSERSGASPTGLTFVLDGLGLTENCLDEIGVPAEP